MDSGLDSTSEQSGVIVGDPTEFQPENKPKTKFREFHETDATPERVVKVYHEMHTKQTLDFAKEKLRQWGKFDHAELTVMEALELLNTLVDESDPDIELPNSMHAFQTAEALRKCHPDKEWLHLVGLIHDLGKVMAIWGEPQWAVVGDTFPVGCRPDNSVVFGVESFKDNPDMKNEKTNTRLGIYEENCGLDKVYMSWGHDEYMYRVLKRNGCTLPEEGLYIVRFHSFYPWHNKEAYRYLCDNKDMEMLLWVQEFSKFDLYSKCPDIPPIEELQPYYQALIDKYIPGKIKF